MGLLRPPPQWGNRQIAAFNDLMNAATLYETYAAALTRLNITTGNLIARRDELRDHITQTLGPAFRDIPPGT